MRTEGRKIGKTRKRTESQTHKQKKSRKWKEFKGIIPDPQYLYKAFLKQGCIPAPEFYKNALHSYFLYQFTITSNHPECLTSITHNS
jgi:hypothetical protein